MIADGTENGCHGTGGVGQRQSLAELRRTAPPRSPKRLSPARKGRTCRPPRLHLGDMQPEGQARPAPDATLDKLQAQLALLPRPAKLLKALTRLSALPPTAALLDDSRLSKALRRLRDYQQPAALAARLLDRWSPILDAPAPAEAGTASPSKSRGRKRSREARAGGNCGQLEPTAPRADTPDATEPAPQGPPRTVPPLRIKLTRLPSGARAAGTPTRCPRGHADSESQAPARLSWEECLDYQPPPRKKQRTKSAQAGQEPRTQHAQGSGGGDDDHDDHDNDDHWALESADGPPARPEDPRPSTREDPQLATALSDSLACRPDPAPAPGDAGEAPLPHWDWGSFGQPSPPRQHEPDLAPCRVNAKTRVFAGSNCSPDQLYRIETCNPGLVPHADHLWKAHCAQKFPTDTPRPGESWRDAYLRLQLAREQRLQALTLNFRSARLTKLQDARTKIVVFHGPTAKPFPLPKTPHVDPEEAIRHEAEPHSAPAPTACQPEPRTNAPTSLPPAGLPEATSANPGPAASQRTQAFAKRKPNKPMPRLMAKSIKDFRTLLSRR
ncbi:elongin-A-like [Sorex araneus]|uniref:elongin-A-like n=1 Tax=Sorex araneus TaxID=42254 RepID=UPI0024335A07|nr:elongin-A-like [Sorex araneus]